MTTVQTRAKNQKQIIWKKHTTNLYK